MRELLRRYIGVFLLLLFIFPQAEKVLHDYKHRNDFHCSTTDRHFHFPEHHCQICDYIPVASDKLNFYNQVPVDAKYITVFFSFYENSVIAKHNYNVSLRAPPTIS